VQNVPNKNQMETSSGAAVLDSAVSLNRACYAVFIKIRKAIIKVREEVT
jgi:hypothetical protein